MPFLLSNTVLPLDLLVRGCPHIVYAGIGFTDTLTEFVGTVGSAVTTIQWMAKLFPFLAKSSIDGLDVRLSSVTEQQLFDAALPHMPACNRLFCRQCTARPDLETAAARLRELIEPELVANQLPLPPRLSPSTLAPSADHQHASPIFLHDGTVIHVSRSLSVDTKYSFEGINEMRVPTCGSARYCARHRTLHMPRRNDVCDASIALNTDEVSSVSTTLLDAALPPSLRCAPLEPLINSTYRASCFYFTHIEWALLFTTSALVSIFANGWDEGDGGLPIRTNDLYNSIPHGVLLCIAHAAAGFAWFRKSPHRPLELWLQPLRIFTFAISAVAAIFVSVSGAMPGSKLGDFARVLSLIVALGCVVAAPLIVVTFLGTLLVSTGSESRMQAVLERVRKAAADAELRRILQEYPQISATKLQEMASKLRSLQSQVAVPADVRWWHCLLPRPTRPTLPPQQPSAQPVNPMMVAGSADLTVIVGDIVILLVFLQSDPSTDPLAATQAQADDTAQQATATKEPGDDVQRAVTRKVALDFGSPRKLPARPDGRRINFQAPARARPSAGATGPSRIPMSEFDEPSVRLQVDDSDSTQGAMPVPSGDSQS